MLRTFAFLLSVLCLLAFDAPSTIAFRISTNQYSYNDDRDRNGYRFEYNVNDASGTTRKEIGTFVYGNGQTILTVKGDYSYVIGSSLYGVSYIADKEGYRANTNIFPNELVATRIGSATLASLAGGGLG